MTPGAQYEQLTAELVATLVKADPAFAGVAVHWGPNCKELGASGFRHQIDVKARCERWLALIECKCLGNDKVGTDEVLILAARKIDIAEANLGLEVWAGMVSRRPPTQPARLLAAHFKISIDTVASAEEYAVRLRHHLRIGGREQGEVSDSATSALRRKQLPTPTRRA